MREKREAAAKKQPARKRGLRSEGKTSASVPATPLTSATVVPDSSSTSSTSDVVTPSTSAAAVPDAQSTSTSAMTPPARKKRKTETEQTSCDECAFCFGVYCNNGEEWIQCACGKWVHEDCIEELFNDASGQEKFCPSCSVLFS